MCTIFCRKHSSVDLHQADIMDEGRQIIKRLNKIPVINDAYNEVREIYQQTKEHNFVFRAYFSVVEYMTKSVVSATTPVIYKIFQSQC